MIAPLQPNSRRDFLCDEQREPEDGAGRTIWWDAENRPISITLAGITTTFTYDGDGKRVRKAETNGSAITTTVYVGSHYEETFAGAVTETVKYYYAGSKRIAMRRAGTLTYIFSDHLGSTSVTLNATTGATSTVGFCRYGATRFSCGQNPVLRDDPDGHGARGKLIVWVLKTVISHGKEHLVRTSKTTVGRAQELRKKEGTSR